MADKPSLPLPTVAAKAVRNHLGDECRVLVFDAHSGFHPDAFAAAIGTLRGGGDCVLLAPPVNEWRNFDDPDRERFTAYPHATSDMNGLFLDRLQRLWCGQDGVLVVTPQDDASLRIAPTLSDAPPVLNASQEDIVTAVTRVVHGHARRPLVLTADRGRGKSTALGVAAARLLLHGLARITVIAPSRAAVATLYRHARLVAGLTFAGDVPSVLDIGSGQLRFCLSSEMDNADVATSDLVLVDEAAAISVDRLERLLHVANRIVFASTVHGYEGSGRGFELRFRNKLDLLMPQWRAMRLDHPVRWADDDPLERQLNRALLLDVELGVVNTDDADHVRSVPAAELAGNEHLLRTAFALLVNAHYQTRPSDLRQLLDNPDVRLWLACRGDNVTGVLLGVLEGGFDAPMADRVLAAERRPRGHLLAQSLAVHAGLDDCLCRRILRVQRIAVHPEARRIGIGSSLLQAARTWARSNTVDLLGCAYGVEPSLLAFWRAGGLHPARLGVRVDAASAMHSLFMLSGVSEQGRQLTEEARERFLRDLPWALGGPLCGLDSRLALALLRGRDCRDIVFDARDCEALRRLADGARQTATAPAVVWGAIVRLAARSSWTDERLAALIAWQVQHRRQDRVCDEFGLAGGAALQSWLRACLHELSVTLCRSG